MSQQVEVNVAAGSAASPLDGRLIAPRTVETEREAEERGGSGGVDLRLRKHRSLWGNAWRQFRRHKLAMAGLIVFVGMVLATFVGSAFYPWAIDEIDFALAGGSLT